ncbi:MAG: MBL fold metallo-hydrolase [Eubacteriales bacterium]
MLKFQFLGSNDSVQEQNNGNTSLLISGSEGTLVIDLSCNLFAAVSAKIDGVILTHEHIDHLYALPSLLHQLWLEGRANPLTLYLSSGLAPLVEGMLDLFQIRQKTNMFEILLCSNPSFSVGSMEITTFKTDHTPHSIGVILQEGGSKLVYTCDTKPLDEIHPQMIGAQVLIHEASGTQKERETLLKKGHSSGYDGAIMAKELKVSQLYLCHLPQGDEAKITILNEARAIFPSTKLPNILEEVVISP